MYSVSEIFRVVTYLKLRGSQSERVDITKTLYGICQKFLKIKQ